MGLSKTGSHTLSTSTFRWALCVIIAGCVCFANLRSMGQYTAALAVTLTQESQPREVVGTQEPRSRSLKAYETAGYLASKFTRTAVVTAVANTDRHRFQTKVWLLPSWQAIASQTARDLHYVGQTNHTLSSSVIADLVLFCEEGACDSLPPGICTDIYSYHSNRTSILQMERSLSAPAPPKCITVELGPNYGPFEYSFLPSLAYLELSIFNSIVLDSNHYDHVLRVDADCILGPGLAMWTPNPNFGAAFGEGFSGFEPTWQYLEEVAKTLSIERSTPFIHGMQSSFYLSTEMIRVFAPLLIKYTNHVYKNEFTKEICGNLEIIDVNGTKKAITNGTRICRWAEWHIGVSTLYGQDLAVNHMWPNASESDIVTARLDVGASYQKINVKAHEVVAYHALGQKHNERYNGKCADARRYYDEQRDSLEKWHYFQTDSSNLDKGWMGGIEHAADFFYVRYMMSVCDTIKQK